MSLCRVRRESESERRNPTLKCKWLFHGDNVLRLRAEFSSSFGALCVSFFMIQNTKCKASALSLGVGSGGEYAHVCMCIKSGGREREQCEQFQRHFSARKNFLSCRMHVCHSRHISDGCRNPRKAWVLNNCSRARHFLKPHGLGSPRSVRSLLTPASDTHTFITFRMARPTKASQTHDR
jgi:hypothetical protein